MAETALGHAVSGTTTGVRANLKARCADLGPLGHEGATYNPWSDQTWCLCGKVVYSGNVATHRACCGLIPAGEMPGDRASRPAENEPPTI